MTATERKRRSRAARAANGKVEILISLDRNVLRFIDEDAAATQRGRADVIAALVEAQVLRQQLAMSEAVDIMLAGGTALDRAAAVVRHMTPAGLEGMLTPEELLAAFFHEESSRRG